MLQRCSKPQQNGCTLLFSKCQNIDTPKNTNKLRTYDKECQRFHFQRENMETHPRIFCNRKPTDQIRLCIRWWKAGKAVHWLAQCTSKPKWM